MKYKVIFQSLPFAELKEERQAIELAIALHQSCTVSHTVKVLDDEENILLYLFLKDAN